MAIQSPFFGKRENESAVLRHGNPGVQAHANGHAASNAPHNDAPLAVPPAPTPVASNVPEGGLLVSVTIPWRLAEEEAGKP